MTTETEKEVLRIVKERQDKARKQFNDTGFSYKKYNSSVECISEAIEEAVDMLQYLVALKLRMQNYERRKYNAKRNSKIK